MAELQRPTGFKDESQGPGAGDISASFPVGLWLVGGLTLYIAVMKISEDGGNRIVRRQRPYRNGAKLDDTASKEKVWVVEGIYNNNLEETGIPDDVVMYPDMMNATIASADIHETGTLQLPTRPVIRCRLESYQRTESSEARDTGYVTFTFVQDNEDNIDAQSFKAPTVRATVRRTVDETTFGMESLGGFSQFLADLEDAAENLEDAMNAPGEAIQDADQKAARVVRLAQNVEDQFVRSANLGRDLLTDPDSWATFRQLRILQDRTASAATEKSSAIAPVVSAIFETSRSLFDIAVELAQDPTDLAAINGHLENLLAIPAGTVVKIFDL